YNLDEPSQRAAFWQNIRNHVREISNGQMRASIGDEVERRIATMRQLVRDVGHKGVPLQFSKGQRPNPAIEAR
ncbi:MAG: hypothetical protein VW554_06905, partial [Alphaproteobacteria bacterium]